MRSEFGGIGINANSQEVGNYRLQVTSVGGISAATGNKFVDCSRAINSGIYFVKIHDSSLNKTLIKKLVVQQ